MFSPTIQEMLQVNSGLPEPPTQTYDSIMPRALAKNRARDIRDRIEGIVPLKDCRIRVLWRSGMAEEINLKPVMIKFSRRPATQRDMLFLTAKPGEDGRSIVWGDGSEISVSSLRELAFAHMTNQEFRQAIGALGLNGEEIAAHLGVSRRSVAGYRTDREIPRAVALAIRFLLHRHSPGTDTQSRL